MRKFTSREADFDQLRTLVVNSQDAKENNSRYQVLNRLIDYGSLLKKSIEGKIGKDDKISLTDQIDGILPPTNGGVATGKYEPIITLGANCGGVGLDFLYFYTTGGLVTVFGRLAVLPLVIGINTEFAFTLPIISYFTFDYQCAGALGCPTHNQNGAILADVGQNRAKMQFISVANVQMNLFFNFSYIIIEQ